MNSALKAGLHPRNRFNTRYDFPQLIACSPALAVFEAGVAAKRRKRIKNQNGN